MTEEFFHYDPVVLGFVFNTTPILLESIKTEIIKAVVHLESDDKGYVYHPDNLKVLKNPGPIVGSVVRYDHPPDFNLSKAMKQLVYFMGMEDNDSKKYCFIILDDYDTVYDYRLTQCLKLDLKEGYNCSFLFCSMIFNFPELDKFTQIHPRCQHLHFPTVENFGDKILKIYKEKDAIV